MLSSTQRIELHDLIWEKLDSLLCHDQADAWSALSLIDAPCQPYDEYYNDYVQQVEHALDDLLCSKDSASRNVAMLVLKYMKSVYQAELSNKLRDS